MFPFQPAPQEATGGRDRAMFRRKLFDADARPRVAVRARVLSPDALFGFISENLSLHAFHIFCY